MSIIENVKNIATLIKQIDNIEAYKKIIDLQAEVMGLVQENNDLKQQLIEAHSRLTISGDLLSGTNSYWRKSHEALEGPYCTGCWDGNHKLVRLIDSPVMMRHRATHTCPVCKILVTAAHPRS